ncbi:hypothetical protein LUX39_10050 [Actinomadura madurae]|nr:hypothetical protein [Actinomadura madurae]MCQ0014070.1 hypothetical protein [Actinomadura madurae]
MERGQPYPPGAFPRSPAEMGRAFWDPHAGLYGMFDVWSFKGCDSVVSSGLGGGSLIYANVLLRKDERWFVHDQPLPGGGYESWPISRADLDPHYDAVEKMMGATPYPLEQVPFDDTPKTHAMQDAAAELGLQCTLPPLAVSFASRPGGTPGLSLPIVDAGYGNVHGVPGGRAGCAASATSAATRAPRTASTTPTCRPRRTTAPTSARPTRSRRSGRGRAAGTRSTTSTTPI